MMALPVIVLLSLLLMWRRSRKRGRIGRKASALLRSVLTLVLGLGGWFAGVILALVAFPSLPLDDVLLAVVSIGVPIGLGIYLAWVDRTRSDAEFGLAVSLCGCARRRLGRLPRRHRAPRHGHHDRRGCGRREPDPARARRRPRSRYCQGCQVCAAGLDAR